MPGVVAHAAVGVEVPAMKPSGKSSYYVALFAAVSALLSILLVACSLGGGTQSAVRTVTPPTATVGEMDLRGKRLYTPQQMRHVYGFDTLIEQGDTGKGQTVVVIDSFGSPTLQQDVDTFDSYYHLPAIAVQVLTPLGNASFDPTNKGMVGWAREAEEDVETVHALAPDARIVLYLSPTTWTEGTAGMPNYFQLEQDAARSYPGSPVSQSWETSESTLSDPASRATVQQWDDFFHTATTQQHMTYFAASGDTGATNFLKVGDTQLASQPTTGFPSDDPWVTAVGGTVLSIQDTVTGEIAWPDSGGGTSAIFPTPLYQQGLPAGARTLLHGARGTPDVAASASLDAGLGVYLMGQWTVSVGTSAGAPVWSALTAILNQKAGHAIGFLNPLLYQLASSPSYGQDFHDITIGNNNVNSDTLHVAGYSAGPGWDAVTGLGSPDAAHLIPDVISLSVTSGYRTAAGVAGPLCACGG